LGEPLFMALRGARAPRRRRRWGRRLVVALLAGALGVWLARGWIADGVRPLHADQRIRALADEIRAAADESGLDPYLLAGLIYAESSGRVGAESSAEALGLCQLRLPTAREQAERMGLEPPSRRRLLRDAELNLRLGAGYLARLIERQDGSVERGLMAYNTGPTRFQRWLDEAGGYEAWRAAVDAEGPPGPGSVRTYAAKVQAQAERMRREGLIEPPDAGR
jgi:soluble lytic murein transglycosylase